MDAEGSVATRFGWDIDDRANRVAHVCIHCIGDEADDFHRNLDETARANHDRSSDRILPVEVDTGKRSVDNADAWHGLIVFPDGWRDVAGTEIASLIHRYADGVEEAGRDVEKVRGSSFDRPTRHEHCSSPPVLGEERPTRDCSGFNPWRRS